MSDGARNVAHGRRWLRGTILLCALLVVLAIATHHWWYLLKSSPPLDGGIETELRTLGARSLPALDVPVGAVLIYKGEIIGRGFNTVNRDSVAYGHAEINAITDALRHFGKHDFMRLDRDSLELITTLEPCPMCVGAIMEYQIHHVSFLKPAPSGFALRKDLELVRYYAQLRQRGSAELQDSLFRQHPGYGKR
jgi:tRNA(Arg) A34 adenosine deaminase TadA